MVYNENQLVNEGIKNLKHEKDNLVARLNNVMDYPDLPGPKELDSYITPDQIQTMKGYITYVNNNHESLSPELLSEIQKNQVFKVVEEYWDNKAPNQVTQKQKIDEAFKSQLASIHGNVVQELATGYEWLLQSLERREKILTHRLDRLLKDYGTSDRILYENKDFKNEPEEIAFQGLHEGKDDLKIEDIISVSEQMGNIYNWKRALPGIETKERAEDLFEYNSPNFNKYDIEYGSLTERTLQLTKIRNAQAENNLIDYTKNKNNQGINNNYTDETYSKIIEKVEDARRNLDTPFDELYHKEKSLIDNVVMAEKELIEAQIKAEKELEKHTGAIDDIIFDTNLSKHLEEEDNIRLLLNKNLSSTDSAESLFTHDQRVKNNYQEAIAACMDTLQDGYISKLQRVFDETMHTENLGYCFATFSHTDGAKHWLMNRGIALTIETQPLKWTLKLDMDHHDFNAQYLKQRTIEDAKILRKSDKLREAKDKLSEYEMSMESHMPKTQKLLKMKEAAKDAIEGNFYYNRETYPRSKLDDVRLKSKIKEVENRIGADLSPLLDSQEKEQERLEKHRKALDTYKSYSFLKAGLNKTSLEKKMTGATEDSSSADYKFPSVDKIAKVFINDKHEFSMLKEAEEDTRLGRKFGFTPRDYLNKYFGKDLNKQGYINLNDRPMYTFNDELKREYPYERLSQVPNLKKIEEESAQNYRDRHQLQEHEKNPLILEHEQNREKEFYSGEAKPVLREAYANNPYVEPIPIQDRMNKYIQQMTERDDNLMPKMTPMK